MDLQQLPELPEDKSVVNWILFAIAAIISGLVGLLKWFVSRELHRMDSRILENTKAIQANALAIQENARQILVNTTYDKGAREQLHDLKNKLEAHLGQAHGTKAYIDDQIEKLRREFSDRKP